jgi:hypothetical protein
VLRETLRALGLAGTELARAQAGTIRLKLLKVGAVVVRNSRRVRLWLSSAFPLQAVFRYCVACSYGRGGAVLARAPAKERRPCPRCARMPAKRHLRPILTSLTSLQLTRGSTFRLNHHVMQRPG